MSDDPIRSPTRTPGYAIVFGILTVPIALLVLLIIVSGLAFLLAPFCSHPTPPRYTDHVSPSGNSVVIVGIKQDPIDRLDWLRAVWIANSGGSESSWHLIVPWRELDNLMIDWTSDDRVIIVAHPAPPSTTMWNGVNIEVR